MTHRDASDAPITYGWAEVIEHAPVGCHLPIPLLTRASFDEATRLRQWPGEQINLKPGDVVIQTLNENVPASCSGTMTLSLVSKRDAHIQRREIVLNIVPS
jgi:hypothetical protein